MARTNNNAKNNQRNVSIVSGGKGERKVVVGKKEQANEKPISLSERFAKINKDKQNKPKPDAKKAKSPGGVKKQNKTKEGAAIKEKTGEKKEKRRQKRQKKSGEKKEKKKPVDEADLNNDLDSYFKEKTAKEETAAE